MHTLRDSVVSSINSICSVLGVLHFFFLLEYDITCGTVPWVAIRGYRFTLCPGRVSCFINPRYCRCIIVMYCRISFGCPALLHVLYCITEQVDLSTMHRYISQHYYCVGMPLLYNRFSGTAIVRRHTEHLVLCGERSIFVLHYK